MIFIQLSEDVLEKVCEAVGVPYDPLTEKMTVHLEMGKPVLVDKTVQVEKPKDSDMELDIIEPDTSEPETLEVK